jgi:5-formyltetrahydrofolate cyclo-ligase
MLKSELRKIYLDRRRTFSDSERRRRSEEIAARFFENFALARVDFLHCFLPIEKFKEIDTRLIFERVWKDFPHVVTIVPRVDFEIGEMENLKFTPIVELAQNRWAIHEPVGDELIESEKIDLVLIPLLCFDRRGARVGYGKGFYDRFLSCCREDCLKIGLSYHSPVDAIEDPHDADVKLDFCVTPTKVWRF